jgi:DUF1707 SHOCT-like domain
MLCLHRARAEVPMMTGPGGEMAAGMASRGAMRTSRAEREQAIELLKIAFVADRLAKDEFDVRAGQALTARTAAELAALTADIPVGPAAAGPLRTPARTNARPPANRVGRTGVCMTLIAAAVLGGLRLTTPDNMGAFVAGVLAAATVVAAPVVTMTTLLHQQRRRQRPAKPGQNQLDSPHLVLLVLTIAVLIVLVLTAFK